MKGRVRFAVLIILLFGVMIGLVAAGTVSPGITYQGILTDSGGNPLTGTYSVTFGLYEVETGGTALATNTQNVLCTNGQFTTAVSFDPSFFDGRALWLAIKVGSDPVMTPRQEIRPVPYAMSLRPGAPIKGSSPNPLFSVWNSGDGPALGGVSLNNIGVVGSGKWGGYFMTNGGGTDLDPRIGVNVSTVYNYNPGIIVSTGGQFSSGLRVSTSGYGSNGLYSATAGETSYGVVATTSGRYSDAIRASTTADDSTGAYLRTYGSRSPGVSVSTSSSNSDGVFTSTSGPASDGVDTSTSGDGSHGVRTTTYGSGSNGVQSQTSGTNSNGVYARTDGDTSYAVNTLTTGPNSIAVHGETTGSNSRAIVGESAQNIGVYGKGRVGGYFTTNSGGTSGNDLRPGVNVSTLYDYNPGIRISTNGLRSSGINARTVGAISPGMQVTTSGYTSNGVEITTEGYGGIGIDLSTSGDGSEGIVVDTKGIDSDSIIASTEGDSSNGISVVTDGHTSHGISAATYGITSNGLSVNTHGNNSRGLDITTYGLDSHGAMVSSWQGVGIEASTRSSNIWYAGGSFRNEGTGNGVYGTSANSYGIFGNTDRADQKYGIYTDDYLYAKGTQVPAADVAEYMPVLHTVEPGTVMIIGEAGILEESTLAYDTKVAGIVSTSPGISLGTKESGNEGEQSIAVAGRVPCKVDACNGPIRPGDLLTTSNNPGHAMKATDPKIGTILGKALGSLESGTGTIEVLVTLQ